MKAALLIIFSGILLTAVFAKNFDLFITPQSISVAAVDGDGNPN